jgi:hypothetical protein
MDELEVSVGGIELPTDKDGNIDANAKALLVLIGENLLKKNGLRFVVMPSLKVIDGQAVIVKFLSIDKKKITRKRRSKSNLLG